jgi:hypothetical protein
LSVELVKGEDMAGQKGVKQDRRVKIAGALFPYDDATETVTVERTLMDVFKGRVGDAQACMNAQCIMRNTSAFPHPVLGVSVVKTRVYVIDAEDHVTRYELSHKDSKLIEAHDEDSIGQPGTLTLRPPWRKKGAQIDREPNRGGGTAASKKKKGAPIVRGELARVKAAVGAL